MKLKSILFFVILFTLPSKSLAEEKFDPENWSEGLHLFAGLGPSSTLFKSKFDNFEFGIGAHLKADLSYVINNSLAVEWSSGTEFNKINGYLSWNTLFTIGIKYRIQRDILFDLASTYIKLFIGRAPTVIFFDGKPPPEYRDNGASRLQFDGNAYGLTSGMYHKTENGHIWFHEFTGIVQSFETYDAIRMEGDVPIEVDHQRAQDFGKIYGAHVSVGMMFF